VAILKEFGIPFEQLDRDACVAVEPALSRVADKIVGGLRLPGDETGDCFKFVTALAAQCVADGVSFHLGQSVSELQPAGEHIFAAKLSDGEAVYADRFVVALGSYSAPLLAPLRLSVPVYPVKGYSATLDVTCAEGAPRSTIMDEAFKVAVTRLGNRVRAAGTAELTGFDTTHDARRCATIVHVVRDLFPDAGDISSARMWAGLRPMTPDGTPIVGPTSFKNLYLNTGHGTLGWTMACGSGRLLADVISGQKPVIAAEAFELSRYRRSSAPEPLPDLNRWRPAQGAL
jgi:D-amino-acid dehydrogenase